MDAQLDKDGRAFTLRFERKLDHPPDKVWRVLTEAEWLSKWFPADIHGEWTVGAPLRFEFRGGEGDGLDESELQGEVLAVDPPRLLEFRWGDGVLRCELKETANGCTLVFSESFTDGSIAARNAAGWEWCLGNLDQVLRDVAPTPFDMKRWRRPFERYTAQFEPVAGPQQEPPHSVSG
jgi:uncharacterized protein YndB with AHSA1/START domain